MRKFGGLRLLLYAIVGVATTITSVRTFKSCTNWYAQRIEAEKIARYQQMTLQEVKAEVNTPEKANWYLTHFIIPKADAYELKSPERLHKERTAVCNSVALMGFYLLEDDGYKQYCIDLLAMKKGEGHGIDVYQDPNTKRWGILGIREFDFQPPRFSDLDAIARYEGFEAYAVELEPNKEFPNCNWTTFTGDLRDMRRRDTSGSEIHYVEKR